LLNWGRRLSGYLFANFEDGVIFMIRVSLCVLVTALLSSVTLVAAGSPHATTATKARIARGKYLVDQVGLCEDCHTPRDSRGNFIADKYLQGALIGFKPVAPVPVWADKSPAIAGLPGWDDTAAMRFLMTGVGFNGLPPRPPMPAYRFNRQDAEAVLAYLRSLAPAGTSESK
jgi:mono/diheme cytochrome c family protein